jgi:glycyl-tRNA synthetase
MPTLNEIISLAKRRGFIYPGSEIYGGLANTYDYGPLGVELLRNIKNAWWKFFVTSRDDMYGLDTNILMNPDVWKASGHTSSFSDTTVDCKNCNQRIRADHLIEDFFNVLKEEKKVEGLSPESLDKIIAENKIPCPNCKKNSWTKARKFNLLFETQIGIVSGDKSTAYLRGEIAQGMFVNFKNVVNSLSPKLPFGLAQSGAAFRNEVTPGKFTFRTLQFNLSELEYFFDSEKIKWEKLFEYWKQEMWSWTTEILNVSSGSIRWRPHTDEERSHYSKRTEDIEYQFPFGFKELYGLAYRTDFDLKNHMEKSGTDLTYKDPETGNSILPHVIEPTFGMDRTLLVLLFEHYKETEHNGKKRFVLSISNDLAPYKIAVFPLVANKPELVKKAREIFENCKKVYPAIWDQRGNIGKRYYAQDEIGTPYCLTIDYQTLEDDSVTVRDRDTMKQERINRSKLIDYFSSKI